METAEELRKAIRKLEVDIDEARRRLEEQNQELDESALHGRPKAIGDARKAIAATRDDLDTAARALQQRREQLVQAEERERIASIRATVAKARREAARGHEIARRLEAMVREYMSLADELEAINRFIGEAAPLAREAGAEKIIPARVADGFVLPQSGSRERAVSEHLRQLRAAA
jgi:hypothetical protein